MTSTLSRTLLFSVILGSIAAACSTETIVDLSLTHTVEIDFHALQANVPAETQRGEIVFDLRDESDYLEFESQLRCVGLDLFASSLHVRRLEAEGLDSVLDFRVDIAPYPDGAWTPLADFAALITDQSSRGFDDDGFKIYREGLDVLEDLAFAEVPQYELKVSSKVPGDVMDLEIGLDLVIVFSSQAGACPGP